MMENTESTARSAQPKACIGHSHALYISVSRHSGRCYVEENLYDFRQAPANIRNDSLGWRENEKRILVPLLEKVRL